MASEEQPRHCLRLRIVIAPPDLPRPSATASLPVPPPPPRFVVNYPPRTEGKRSVVRARKSGRFSLDEAALSSLPEVAASANSSTRKHHFLVDVQALNRRRERRCMGLSSKEERTSALTRSTCTPTAEDDLLPATKRARSSAMRDQTSSMQHQTNSSIPATASASPATAVQQASKVLPPSTPLQSLVDSLVWDHPADPFRLGENETYITKGHSEWFIRSACSDPLPLADLEDGCLMALKSFGEVRDNKVVFVDIFTRDDDPEVIRLVSLGKIDQYPYRKESTTFFEVFVSTFNLLVQRGVFFIYTSSDAALRTLFTSEHLRPLFRRLDSRLHLNIAHSQAAIAVPLLRLVNQFHNAMNAIETGHTYHPQPFLSWSVLKPNDHYSIENGILQFLPLSLPTRRSKPYIVPPPSFTPSHWLGPYFRMRTRLGGRLR